MSDMTDVTDVTDVTDIRRDRRGRRGRDGGLSYFLCRILRHRGHPDMAPDGSVLLDSLLGTVQASREDCLHVIQTDDKGRFQLSSDDLSSPSLRVRCVQGHSLQIEHTSNVPVSLEDAVNLGGVLVHGTSREALSLIEREGIRRMSRAFVHCGARVPCVRNDVPGVRHGTPVYITIDLVRSLQDGHEWFQTPSGAYLTPTTVEPRYFLRTESWESALESQRAVLP